MVTNLLDKTCGEREGCAVFRRFPPFCPRCRWKEKENPEPWGEQNESACSVGQQVLSNFRVRFSSSESLFLTLLGNSGDKPLINSVLSGDFHGRPSSAPFLRPKQKPGGGGQQVVHDDPSGTTPLMECLVQGKFYMERPAVTPALDTRRGGKLQEIECDFPLQKSFGLFYLLRSFLAVTPQGSPW